MRCDPMSQAPSTVTPLKLWAKISPFPFQLLLPGHFITAADMSLGQMTSLEGDRTRKYSLVRGRRSPGTDLQRVCPVFIPFCFCFLALSKWTAFSSTCASLGYPPLPGFKCKTADPDDLRLALVNQNNPFPHLNWFFSRMSHSDDKKKICQI